MKDEILTKQELAEILKVNDRTIDKLRKKGLPSFNVGRQVRFEKNVALKWIQENQ